MTEDMSWSAYSRGSTELNRVLVYGHLGFTPCFLASILSGQTAIILSRSTSVAVFVSCYLYMSMIFCLILTPGSPFKQSQPSSPPILGYTIKVPCPLSSV